MTPTEFIATPVEVHDLQLADLDQPEALDKLWALFHEPEKLRPGLTSERITSQAAAQLAELAQSMRTRGLDPRAVARFLDRIVFCLFAEDIALAYAAANGGDWSPDTPDDRLLEQLLALNAARAQASVDVAATLRGAVG